MKCIGKWEKLQTTVKNNPENKKILRISLEFKWPWNGLKARDNSLSPWVILYALFRQSTQLPLVKSFLKSMQRIDNRKVHWNGSIKTRFLCEEHLHNFHWRQSEITFNAYQCFILREINLFSCAILNGSEFAERALHRLKRVLYAASKLKNFTVFWDDL